MFKKILIGVAMVVLLSIIKSEALSMLALSVVLGWTVLRLVIRDGGGS